MICGRFVFLIIYFAFSGFDPSYSWSAKFNLSNTNITSEKTLLNQDTVNSIRKIYFRERKIVNQVQSDPQKLVHPQLKAPPTKKAIAQERSLHTKPSSTINRLWGFGAMGLTSALAVFLIWILFTKPRQQQDNLKDIAPANKKLNLSKVTGLSDKISKTQSDAGENDLFQDVAVTKSTLNIALDNFWEVKKSTVQDEVNQANIPLANVDKIQQFIHALEHLDNCNEPTLVQTALKRKAIWQLAEAEKYYSIEPLLKVMPQAKALDQNLILEVVKQINQRNYQSINQELFAALQNEKPEVRLKALRDLKKLYQFVSPVITKIAQMHSDRDYEVRQSAIELLRSLNASPLPTFYNYADGDRQANNLIMGEESGANLHLIAYLLAELDAEK
jgi:hypothetical protein